MLAAKVAAILAVTIVVERVLKLVLKSQFAERARVLHVDPTTYKVITRLISLGVWVTGLAFAGAQVPQLRALSRGIFLSAGVAGIILGLAVKDTFSNVFAGLFIAFSHPFRVGDTIRTENEEGIVEDITLRHTVIRTWFNERLIIPNEKMNTQNIMNYDIQETPIRKKLEVGVSYDADVDLAKQIMLEEAEKRSDVIKKEDLVVRVVELGESSVKLRLLFWVEKYREGFFTLCDLRERVKKRFDQEGITIPFPQRTISYLHGEQPVKEK